MVAKMDYLGLNGLNDMISKFVNSNDLELEIRFMKDNVSDIGVIGFNKIKSFMQQYDMSIERSTVVSFMKIRSVRVGDNVQYMMKERIVNVDLESIGIRISLSSETSISADKASVLNNNTEITTRNRERYSINYNGVRIDLTKILGTGTYELELECITKDNVISRLNKCYETVFTILNDSSMIYTAIQASDLIEFVNRKLLDFNDIKTRNLFPQSNVRSKISYYPFPRPRNLKHEDLTYKGIVGGKDSYSCTYKADGEHKILVFGTYGTWLVHPPNFITLVDNYNYGLEGLMLEGELIPMNKRRDGNTSKFLFYVYDCISTPDDGTNIQQVDLVIRMEYAQTYADIFRDENILETMDIRTKNYMALTPDNFFDIIKDVVDNENNAPYDTDGIIFVPNTGPYNSHSGSLRYSDRVLTNYPDIVKWKPADKLTIDFLVKDIGNRYELYVNEGRNNNLFSKRPEIPKGDLQIPDGSIVELGFIGPELSPVMHRIRDDKIIPNSKEVAEVTYKDIINPITADMIAGRSFKLVRAYHNRIKKNLFNYVADKGHKVLLDLGSGRGGDIGKWRHFDKIFAVEPNADNIVELKKRLSIYGMNDKVVIIQAGAQDTDTIKNEMKKHGYSAVSCIASMLSLTFLWEGGHVNQGLLNTLNELLVNDGHFIYLVMDSDHVTQLFRPIFGNTQLSKVDFGSAVIEWRDNSKVHVHVDDSIVTEQDEWLVKLDDISMGLRNFTEEKRVRADKELLLPFNEKMFSSLFTYGAYQKKKTNVTYPKPYESRIPKLNYQDMTVEGDCELYSLNCNWYDGSLVGVTTIGDGSCFFHSILKCINPSYFSMSLQEKLDAIYGFRDDIATALNDYDTNGIPYYSYTAASQFQNVADMYKLDNLSKLISNPHEYVGDFIYGIISALYGYDIVVLEYRNETLVTHCDTLELNSMNNVIFIVAYDGHFESIIEYNDQVQESPYTFVFKPDSELVKKYIHQKKSTKGSRK